MIGEPIRVTQSLCIPGLNWVTKVHCSDVARGQWHVKSLETELFVQLIKDNSKEITKALYHWPFVRGIHL